MIPQVWRELTCRLPRVLLSFSKNSLCLGMLNLLTAMTEDSLLTGLLLLQPGTSSAELRQQASCRKPSSGSTSWPTLRRDVGTSQCVAPAWPSYQRRARWLGLGLVHRTLLPHLHSTKLLLHLEPCSAPLEVCCTNQGSSYTKCIHYKNRLNKTAVLSAAIICSLLANSKACS